MDAENCPVCLGLPVPGPCCWGRSTIGFVSKWRSAPLISKRVPYPCADEAGDSHFSSLNEYEDFSRACAVFVEMCEQYCGDALLRATGGKPDLLRRVWGIGRKAAQTITTSSGQGVLQLMCRCVYDVASDHDASVSAWGMESAGDELASRLLEGYQLADCMFAVLQMIDQGDSPMSVALEEAKEMVSSFAVKLQSLRHNNLERGRVQVKAAADILRSSGAEISYTEAVEMMRTTQSVSYGNIESVTMVALATLGVVVKTDRWVESVLRCVAERCGGVVSEVMGRPECPLNVSVGVAPYKSVRAGDRLVALDGLTGLKVAETISFAVDWRQGFLGAPIVEGRFITVEAVPRKHFPVLTAEVAKLAHELEEEDVEYKGRTFMALKKAAVEGQPMEGVEAALAVAQLRQQLQTSFPQLWPVLAKLYTTKAIAAAYATSQGKFRSFSLKLKQRIYIGILAGYTRLDDSDVTDVWSNARGTNSVEMLAHDAIRTKRAWIRVDSRVHSKKTRTNHIPDAYPEMRAYIQWEGEYVPTASK